MLIGINGQYGSGKDTVFARLTKLVPEFDGAKKRVAFADKLKDSVCALLQITREELEVAKVQEFKHVQIVTPGAYQVSSNPTHVGKDAGYKWAGQSMREFLQRYGTEAHRDIFGTNFWVDVSLPSNFQHDDRLVVVTDVRFPNEAARIHDLGGRVWRLVGKNDRNDGHASEQPLPRTQIDHTIYNTVWDDNYATLDEQIRDALALVRA